MTSTRSMRSIEERVQADLDDFLGEDANIFDIDPRVKEEGYGYLNARCTSQGAADPNIERLLAQRYELVPAIKHTEGEGGFRMHSVLASRNPYAGEYYCKSHDIVVMRRADHFNKRQKEFDRKKYTDAIRSSIGHEEGQGGLNGNDAMKLLYGGGGF